MTRAIPILVVMITLSGEPVQAGAAVFSGSAQVSATVSDGIDGNANDGPNAGFPASASVSQTWGSPGQSATASGQADVSLITPPGFSQGFTWQTSTQAHFSTFLLQPIFPVGRVTSKAVWQDVLFLSSTDPNLVGGTLRLNFRADLDYSIEGVGPGANTVTDVTVVGTNDRNAPMSTAEAHTGYNTVNQTASGWDSLVSVMPVSHGADLTGAFHLDIPIVPGKGYVSGVPGSFYYQVGDVSDVSGQWSGSMDAADPFGFDSITLPDVGNVTPESLGVSVSFASGIIPPNATPEPSTLALFGVGIVALTGGYSWRRRSAR